MSFAHEFPNDNPELFAARPLTALHLATLHLAPLEAPDVEAADIEVVDAFDEADFENATLESLLPPPPEASVDADEGRVDEPRAEVVLGEDGDSIIEPALESEPSPEPVPASQAVMTAAEPDYYAIWVETLRDVASAHGASGEALAALGEQLASDPVARAWSVAITGGEADFSVCGTQTLDEWSANLIARVAGTPAKLESIRRALRGRGVCAFGLIVEAA